jgi:hypothetical protein
VLQEVAAVQHVVIMCGFVEIDGYAFFSGLKVLQFSHPTALSTIPYVQSLTSLIDRPGRGISGTTNEARRFSLRIRSLVELVNMFHTCHATVTRDKVYALLGMSGDDPNEVGIRPDYEVSWKVVFKRLIQITLPNAVSVKTFEDCQTAIITSKAVVLGVVSSVILEGEKQIIEYKPPSWCDSDLESRTWEMHMSAKPIHKDDIVCLLHGSQKPTIIRLATDYFHIIVIALNLLVTRKKSPDSDLIEVIHQDGALTMQRNPEIFRGVDFVLVCDWEKLPKAFSNRCDFIGLMETISNDTSWPDKDSKALVF